MKRFTEWRKRIHEDFDRDATPNQRFAQRRLRDTLLYLYLVRKGRIDP